MIRRLTSACPSCASDMVLRNSRYGLFYGCSAYPRCAEKHGAHPDGRPLGVPADFKTRQAHIRAHAAFDQLWQGNARVSRSKARKRAYHWLMRTMSLTWDEAHIGRFTIDQCEKLIRLCAAREVLPRRYDTWEYL